MDKIKDLLFKNIGLKILSLMIAIVLWIVSMNINNPEMTKTYVAPLSLLNLNHVNESGMVILNEEELSEQDVYIKVKSTRNDLASLDSSRISASIDFSPLDITNANNIGESIPVSVYVSIPSINYEIVDYSPRTVDVSFDELTTKDIPINIDVTGVPSNGYEVLGGNIVSPDYVTVKGAKSYVDDISTAEIYVNLDGVSSPINDQYPITILDINGNDVTDEFSLSSQSANVIVNVVKVDSLEISKPKISGEPQSGYEVIGTTWSPKIVDVIGDENIIQELGAIQLPDINIAGATGSVTKVIDLNELLEPIGLSVQSGAEDKCTVVVDIEPVITKVVDMPTSNITFNNISEINSENLSVPETIKVTITGPENEIVNFDPDTITGIVDASLYNVGDEDVEVDVSCSNSKVEVQTPVRLSITDSSTEENVESEITNEDPTSEEPFEESSLDSENEQEIE